MAVIQVEAGASLDGGPVDVAACPDCPAVCFDLAADVCPRCDAFLSVRRMSWDDLAARFGA